MAPAAQVQQDFTIPAEFKSLSKEAMLKKLKDRFNFTLPIVSGKQMYASRENVAYFLAREMGILNKKAETDDQIDARLTERFEAMDYLTELAIQATVRSLIIVGAPGLGKTYGVDKKLREYDPRGNKYTVMRGYMTPTGLYKQLWDHRMEGMILVLDDCDAIRKDEVGMNLLKVATDTSDVRRISYIAENNLISDRDQSRIPKSFEFNGTVIFITNEDLESNEDEHITALVNRAQYVNLTLRSRRDALVRIRQVVAQGMLNDLPERDRREVMVYVEKHYNALRDLSLRTVLKIANLKKNVPDRWEQIAKVSLFPN